MTGTRRRIPLIGVFAALVLAACAQTRPEPPDVPAVPRYKVGSPYQVSGRWYYPKVDYEYDRRGIASWYGEPFHGRLTANGDIYDMEEMTAAHPTLPMPSLVEVTNLDNGRSARVTINDRGPFVDGRIIDLSRRAAKELGFQNQGTARVRVRILPDESRTLAARAQTATLAAAERAEAVPVTSVDTIELTPLPDPTTATSNSQQVAAVARTPRAPTASSASPASPLPSVSAAPPPANPTIVAKDAPYGRIYVQAASFVNYENASRLASRLVSVAPTQIAMARVNDRDYYRVLLGPVPDSASADILLSRIVEAGHGDATIVVN